MALVATMAASAAQAQHISVDGRLSPAQTLIGPNYSIGANLGKQIGGNLFQSFGIFGLATGESATFSGPATVTNVIGRVTGGSPSSINGAIRSTIPGANVYLINPAGIVFGPNAAVNISGSFHASTADYLKLSDGSRFQASSPDGSTLTAAAPAAFGFLNAAPPAITVNGSTLGVSAGKTLDLAAGPVSMAGGALQAGSGTLRVVGVAGTGEVPVDPLNASALTVTQFAPVSFTQGAALSANNFSGAGGSGSVLVTAGAFTLSAASISALNGSGNRVAGGPIAISADSIALADGASIASITFADTAAGGPITLSSNGPVSLDRAMINSNTFSSAPSGMVRVQAGSLSLTNGSGISSLTFNAGNAGPINVSVTGALSLTSGKISSNPFNAGNAGAINITAGSGVFTAGGGVGSVAQSGSSGMAGDITVNIAGALTIDGAGATQNSPSLIASQTLLGATGKAGHAAVSAQSLSVINGGVISTSSFGAGGAGQVLVNAGNIVLSNSGVIFSDTFGTGSAGAVNVVADNVSLTSSGRIASTSQGGARGNAGNVSVNVSGTLTIDGTGATMVLHSGIFALSVPGSSGAAGQVAVTAGHLTLINPNADISTTTFGAGAGGRVNVVADDLFIGNSGSIGSLAFGGGNAGQVTVAAGNLTINGGFISTNTVGSGSGGTIAANVSGALIVASGGILAQTQLNGAAGGAIAVDAGSIALTNAGTISSNSLPGGGNAGSVNVSASNVSLASGGQISANTLGAGAGGDVFVSVGNSLTISDARSTITGIFAQALGTGPNAGNAGQVNVKAMAASLADGGMISTTTFGPGNAGSVTVGISGSLSVGGGLAGITSKSQSSDTSAGKGGRVAVSANSLVVFGGGQIATTAEAGKGGDINLAARDILLDGTGPLIAAESNGQGDAGSIVLSATNLTLKNGASISTQAATANGGNIVLAVGNFLRLADSKITTSVNGSVGNGGNILIDPQLVLLDNSKIIAQAVAGHGGNIRINANNFIASNDSLVSASSQLGISGTVDLVGPRVDLNGSLVVLPSDLRDAATVARTSCDARAGSPSSLIDRGYGGLPQDTEAPVPALYIVNRDLTLDLAPLPGKRIGDGGWLPPLPQAVRLTMGCG